MGWDQLCLDELIQLVEVDVGKDWANHTALWRSAQRRVIFPILQITCIEQVGEQPQEALIAEFLVQDRQQHRMVDAVEALRYVSLDKPLDSSPALGDLSEGGMPTSLRAEPVGVWAELRLVVGVQERAHYFLQQFIRPCWYSERTQLPGFLGNVRSSDWGPSIAFVA